MKILSKHWLDNTEDTYILRLFQQERAGGRKEILDSLYLNLIWNIHIFNFRCIKFSLKINKRY